MDDHGRARPTAPTLYALDTNVLIHDPNAILNFEEHHVAIPMTVLEELDKLKTGKQGVAAECRQAIRLIDKILGEASPEQVEHGVPIQREKSGPCGFLSILMSKSAAPITWLPEDLNDNKIINQLVELKTRRPGMAVVLVTKDINMRLKARACGIDSEDYHTDQLVDDVSLLSRGYHTMAGSFWERVSKVETRQDHGRTWHRVQLTDNLPAVHVNEFIVDEQGFVGWIKGIKADELLILDLHQEPLLHQEAWGLRPRDIYQALALFALLDPDIHLVNLSGAAGSGKTILALAAAIEQTMVSKRYRRIIATRSVQGLDQEIGFLPGTEAEKMEPWLGAITDNLEALHMDDESTHGSVDYILSKLPAEPDPDRRVPEPDAAPDEDHHHPCRHRFEGDLPGQPGADRHPLPVRTQLRPDLPHRALQGLPPWRAHHPAGRAPLGAGGIRRNPHVTNGRRAERSARRKAFDNPGICIQSASCGPFHGARQRSQAVLTHLDSQGRASMVDVTEKAVTAREATAEARVRMRPETLAMIQSGGHPKGDVFAVARIAGIQAAKKTSDLIPLCHPLMLTSVKVELAAEGDDAVRIVARCKLAGQTGVEMEALTAASVAALTLYDMCKAVDRGMTIESVRLLEKLGGKSGHYQAGE
ncbi:hypothetical protein Lal_00012352 [Lupinus albus]|nr:hypothetical protein Lal_00012352 [Lupinus albus]